MWFVRFSGRRKPLCSGAAFREPELPVSMCTVSSIVLLLAALIELPFAAKSFLEALLQKSEQFVRGTELQPLAGIYFFHRPFELASSGVPLESEPYDNSSTHVRHSKVFSEAKVCGFRTFFVDFLFR